MRKLLLILSTLLLLLLSSCELFYPTVDKDIYLVTVALSYRGTDIGLANPKNILTGTLPDQKALRSQLKLLSEKAGYDFKEIAIIQDNGRVTVEGSFNDTFDNRNTKADLIKAFSIIRKNITEDDIFIFYYSGHGYPSDGTMAFTYSSQMLPLELISEVSTISGKKLIIMDSCYSGNYVQDEEFVNSSLKDAFSSILSSNKYMDEDIWVMAASQRIQRAWDSGEHGFFTKALLTLLGYDVETETAKNNTSGVISYLTLARKIPSLMETTPGYEDYEMVQYPLYTSTTRDLILFDF